VEFRAGREKLDRDISDRAALKYEHRGYQTSSHVVMAPYRENGEAGFCTLTL
jgi:hypothetical protein